MEQRGAAAERGHREAWDAVAQHLQIGERGCVRRHVAARGDRLVIAAVLALDANLV